MKVSMKSLSALILLVISSVAGAAVIEKDVRTLSMEELGVVRGSIEPRANEPFWKIALAKMLENKGGKVLTLAEDPNNYAKIDLAEFFGGVVADEPDAFGLRFVKTNLTVPSTEFSSVVETQALDYLKTWPMKDHSYSYVLGRGMFCHCKISAFEGATCGGFSSKKQVDHFFRETLRVLDPGSSKHHAIFHGLTPLEDLQENYERYRAFYAAMKEVAHELDEETHGAYEFTFYLLQGGFLAVKINPVSNEAVPQEAGEVISSGSERKVGENI